MTLHIVSRSPWSDPAFRQCHGVLLSGDTLLLSGDGVDAARPGTAPAAALGTLAPRVRVCALADDCELRGLSDVAAGVELIDHAEFVALACAHARSVAWF